MAVCRRAGAGLLVVPNASPYERGKDDVRLDLVVRRAREAGAALAYANMVGGQDELVFDGDSILVAADGALLARGPQFEEALVVADLDLPAAPGRTGRGPAGGRGRRHRDHDQAGDAAAVRSGPAGTMDMEEAPRQRASPRSSGRRAPGCSGRGCPIRPRCTGRWSSGSGTTCARTVSAR